MIAPQALRERIKSMPILGSLVRLALLLPHLRLGRQIGLLFGERGFRTAAGGLSHARFVQFTELSHDVSLRMLDILEQHNLPYLLFAGHLIGYQRDGRIPLWNDDLDIMIFPDAFDLFESRCIPALERAGFHVLSTTDWEREKPFGGYSLFGLSRTDSHNNLRLTESDVIRAPRSQVDVFFSRVDAEGFVRNVGGWWGRYHMADLPANVVLPVGEIELNGRRFPSYRDPAVGVRLEYGPVQRLVHVYSHFAEHPHLLFLTPSWERFQKRLSQVINRTTATSLPGGPESPRPVQATGHTYAPDDNTPLAELLRVLSTENFDTIILPGMLALWVIDLKHWFPGLRVLFRPTSEEDAALGFQLAHVIDGTIKDGQ